MDCNNHDPIAAYVDRISYQDFKNDGAFTISDVWLLFTNLFMAPGNQYASMLSETPLGQFFEISAGGSFAFLISFLLLSPFYLWLFIGSQRYGLAKTLLHISAALMALFCLSIPLYLLMT